MGSALKPYNSDFLADANGNLAGAYDAKGREVGLATVITNPPTGRLKNMEAGGVIVDTLSSTLQTCIPAHDAATSFKDISGNAADMTVESGNSGAFSADGYFKTTAAADGGLQVPQAKLLLNPARESFIFSMVLFNRATPGASENIIGMTRTAGPADGQGWYISHRAATGNLLINTLDNAKASLGNTGETSLSFSGANRHICVAYDAPTGAWSIYRDGVLCKSAIVNAPGGAGAFADAVSTSELRIGNLSYHATLATTVVVQGRALQFAKFVGSLPLNIGVLAARLAETPAVPISWMEW